MLSSSPEEDATGQWIDGCTIGEGSRIGHQQCALQFTFALLRSSCFSHEVHSILVQLLQILIGHNSG